MRHLVWFRSDLRVADNPALFEACVNGATVSAIYIDCLEQWQSHGRSAIQRDFLSRHLQALSAELSQLGIDLTLLEVARFSDVPQCLAAWLAKHPHDALYANREIAIDERRRDKAVQAHLKNTPSIHVFNGDCVFNPGSLTTQSGDMYKVFTPFSKTWLAQLRASGFRLLPPPNAQAKPLTPRDIELKGERVSSNHWPCGERAAAQRLAQFCESHLYDYGHARDYPAVAGTSGLSPYLALGVLSPNQCLAAIEQQLGFLPMSRGEQGFAWLNELIWREFYRHLMVAFPQLSMNRAFKPDTEGLQWSQDSGAFQAWCQGQTGYPIVDAAMRCLNATGWMHNRLRMIVASFLTKDLHLSWRQGEDYFMSCLIDGELAANNGGWQWAAGTGADAAPYFRVFNPTTQGERFDGKGEFIRQWLPELADVPTKYIHSPHDWLNQHQPAHQYPAPIVDHKRARLHAIAMFDALKDNSREHLSPHELSAQQQAQAMLKELDQEVI
ncbi:deoxyribodipyrimidine photo-lyase [Oceanisphaera avium]|uniref:Deoxyribodipyrimidine photo-lyase n=1 Tax=Oceanisphaera avium TaxID=1903694 RepID=A0A1Y0D188_9GAMM|nr:deoxyribodipyrimidine photo-lyase [Oceanisphaera avium]ART81104.1 deoxyribodipyrimidine photo-lyase [Oceanisphaera avium]